MLRPYTSRTALSTVAVPRELVQRQRAPAGARECAHLTPERAAAHPRDTERERPPDQVVAKHLGAGWTHTRSSLAVASHRAAATGATLEVRRRSTPPPAAFQGRDHATDSGGPRDGAGGRRRGSTRIGRKDVSTSCR